MKNYGYMGKILWVDLSAKTIKSRPVAQDIYKEYLTGYGLGAKVLFDEKVYAADPLGEDNVLGIMSGLLTNTGAFFSGRWEVVGKSPLTGGWGDANCGGFFAPAIKNAGFDGIFFTGISIKPVYLLIDGEKIELRDAEDLWGKDTAFTEDTLKQRHGANFRVASIGKGGETLCRYAAIITDKGRAAARSGLGAVMGSKKLKALCLGGQETTAIFDIEKVSRVTGDFMNALCLAGESWKDKLVSWIAVTPFFAWMIRFLQKHNILSKIEPADIDLYGMRKWGTCSTTAMSANNGDSPVKNWKGVGYVDFPAKKASLISDNAVIAHEIGKFGCHHCPLRCGGKTNFPKKSGDYPLPKDDPDPEIVHKIEYETSCGFGTMLLCHDLAAIVELNEMLNRAGIDTISCAVVVAWAMEAYEQKIITKQDTGGLELEWGNPDHVKKLVQMIIDNDKNAFGAILKEGVQRAAAHFAGSEKFAMHAGGQELPMHDPRQIGGISLGIQYEVEPTPGRHTSTCDACSMFRPAPQLAKSNKIHKLKGRLQHLKVQVPHNVKNDPVPDGASLRDASCMADLVNGLGLCMDAFGLFPTPPPLLDWINGATGWNMNFEDYLKIGRRIKTVRHSFNVLAGITLTQTHMPDRARGYEIVDGKKTAVLKKGPNARRMPDIDQGDANYYTAMGFDQQTGKPSDEVLHDLNLDYIIKAFHKQGK